MARKPLERFVLGRKDKADFPELALTDVDIKIDTGAFTSSIHCHGIEPFDRDGATMVSFNVLDPAHRQYGDRRFTLPVFRRRTIKNSFGAREGRFTVQTVIELFGRRFAIELALADRRDMTHPVLIGRKFLRKGFLVDINRYNLSYRRKKRKGLAK